MIYEHSAIAPVSKIQVTEIDRLYNLWVQKFHQRKDLFYEFLKTPEAQIFICQHQTVSVEHGIDHGIDTVILTSKFA
jgi:hypothetical protein